MVQKGHPEQSWVQDVCGDQGLLSHGEPHILLCAEGHGSSPRDLEKCLFFKKNYF